MRKLFNVTFLVATLALVTACSGGGSSSSRARTFVDNLNYHDPFVDYYSLEKSNTIYGGRSVIIVGSFAGDRAIDIDTAHRWEHLDDLEYFVIDSWPVWYDGGNVWVDEWGNLYMNPNLSNKAQAKLKGDIKDYRKRTLTKGIQETEGFSQKVAAEIAGNIIAIKDAMASGSLTDKFVDDLTASALGGLSAQEAVKTYMSGTEAEVDGMLKNIAEARDFTVKEVKGVLNALVQLSAQ